MGWVSPTGHDDVDGKWTSEANAYDENTGSYANNFVPVHWLELTLTSAISCDKVRIYCSSAGGTNAWLIDVYYSGAWHNIFDDELAEDQWVEVQIGSTQTVSKARVRCDASSGHLYEFDFNEAAGGQTHYGSATLSGAGALAGLARLLLAASATLSGAGALSAAAGLIRYGSATLAGIGTLAGAAVLTIKGAATLAGTGTLAAAAVKILSGAAALSGVGSLSAIGTLLGEVFGSATLAGQGLLSVIAESWHVLTSQEYQDLLLGQIEFQEV